MAAMREAEVRHRLPPVEDFTQARKDLGRLVDQLDARLQQLRHLRDSIAAELETLRARIKE
jgi:hypothetical protein